MLSQGMSCLSQEIAYYTGNTRQTCPPGLVVHFIVLLGKLVVSLVLTNTGISGDHSPKNSASV